MASPTFICSICRTDLTLRPMGVDGDMDNEIKALLCGHIFHDACVKTWLYGNGAVGPNGSGRCPNCNMVAKYTYGVRIMPVTVNMSPMQAAMQQMQATVESMEQEIEALRAKHIELTAKNHQLIIDFTVTKQQHSETKESSDNVQEEHVKTFNEHVALTNSLITLRTPKIEKPE